MQNKKFEESHIKDQRSHEIETSKMIYNKSMDWFLCDSKTGL